MIVIKKSEHFFVKRYDKKNNLSEKQIRNLFLTGPPSSGKTTAIKKVLAKIERKATGFHTEELIKRTGWFF